MDDTLDLIEAGRVLSRRNAERLRAALEALTSILAEVDPPETEAAEARRARPLAEARNVAEWFEASIHREFTVTADYMFGEGRLTRDERIALSSGIGAALDAFRAMVMGAAPGLYLRDPYHEPDGEMAEAAAFGGDVVPLREAAAVAADGTIDACLITPGWGSSGYYPAEVLRRDGPRIFTAGLHSYLDHPTRDEDEERPERSVRDLAGALADNAEWREAGWNGPGLYARVGVVETERATVDALARIIGMSIRASGYASPGEAEGRRGAIVERLTAAQSVDFVTVPGRGGAIRVLAEAARRRQAADLQERPPMSDDQTQAAPAALAESAIMAELRTLRESIAAERAARESIAADLERERGVSLIQRVLMERQDLPELARARIAAAVRPTVGDDGRLSEAATRAAVETQIEGEIAYLNSIAGPGRIRGLGESRPRQDDPAQIAAELTASFAAMGLSESAAKIAAGGR